VNGVGRVQRQIMRAVIANPHTELCTADLLRWAYPRLTEYKWHHWYCVRRAAERVAVHVGRRRYGGNVYVANPHPVGTQREHTGYKNTKSATFY
jgi:hypothetical protein